MAVSAATGVLAPVLAKLSALLDDQHYKLTEATRSDAISIRSQLKAVHSLLLPTICGRIGDDDGLCKDDLIAEVRELSYDLDDAVDDFLEFNFEQRSTSPFGQLKARVEHVSDRFSDSDKNKWKLPVASLPPPSVHRRASLPPPDAELVGMDKRMEELIKLLEQGSSDASRWRKRKPHFPVIGKKQKIVIKVAMESNISCSKALALAASTGGVDSVALAGDLRDQVVVVGDGIDPIKLISALRKKVGHAVLLQVSQANKYVKETTAMLAPVKSICEFHEVKTVCILGLPGGGKATVARVLYHTLGKQFQCRVFTSISPNSSPSPNLTETLADIFAQSQLGVTDTLSTPYGGTGTALQQHLIDNISTFLLNKKYLIVIDDIWHWEEWEVIRKSIPKNDLGGRIIMTTRLNSIAEKCHTDDNDVFVYEVGDLDNNDALSLYERIATKSGRIGTGKDNPHYDIVNMCYGMPLALICLSSALSGEIGGLGADEVQKWRALRHMEDGILDMRVLKPLAESLCLGYDHLPLHLRTLLLYCSAYHWVPDRHRIERGRLVRRWVAEGFVSEEKEAEGYFGKLIDRGWITQYGYYHGRSIKQDGDKNSYYYYEIHPVILAFLRCKSKEYNFVTCLGLGSDTSTSASSPRLIRRLSLQGGYPVDCLSGSSMSMDVSHTRSLVVLGDVAGIPFHMFKRLRVLDLEDNKDIQDSHLQGICEQLSLRLRYLGLKGTRIRKLPQEIRKLKHLEILYVGSTQISELPQEIGELKHLRILDVRATAISALPRQMEELQEHLQTLDATDTPISELPLQVGKLQNLKTMCVRNTRVRELPKEIGELKHLQTLDVRNTRVRELPWECGQMSESLRVLAGDSDELVQLPVGVRQALGKGSIPEARRAKFREILSIAILDRFGPPLVGIFKVPGRHMRIPELIRAHFAVLSCLDIRLCNKLEDDDQKFLAKMPNLQTLVLRFEALPRELVCIKGEGFRVLENLRVDSRVPRITFEKEAMPNLKLLEFKFYAGPPTDDPVCITNLKNLQKVIFRCTRWYKSDAPGISDTIDVVKKEAKEHPNRIALLISDAYKEISIESHRSSENIAGSSGTSGIDTEPAQAQHDNLPVVLRDGYKGKGILDGRCPTYGRPTKIEEETQDRVTEIEIQTETS
uniref:Uncharacterized protein n=2 Tax=Oryza punctata TaxID=4537 RepID=A0A0E0MI96_ORYPU